VKLPIRFNGSVPIHIELLRFDFETNKNETIEIKGKEVKTMVKQASKRHPDDESNSLVLEYTVKKPGLYRLQKVVDISNLEVQRRTSDTLVVTCPKATIKPSTSDRCQGDLSDVTIEVKGIPPMKIVYRRTVNKEDQSFHFQSIQPENLISPLLGLSPAGTLVSSLEEGLSWGRSHSIDVRLNESMMTSGKWIYAIDEVHDAVGNIANFSADVEDSERLTAKRIHLEQAFTVHERPVAQLKGCDTHNPLKFAKGTLSSLPVEFGPTGTNFGDTKYTVTWKFSPLDELTASGDHGENATIEEFTVKRPRQKPEVHRTGLYTLMSVRNQFCSGEIKEPASCLLLHPPEPDLSITTEDIYDKCAGNAIGLLVDLDLTGTPPFVVHFEIIQNRQVKSHQIRVDGSRHQLELKPADAGHFTYRFTSIDDRVYGAHPLNSQALTLERDVKPPASAFIIRPDTERVSCIGEGIRAEVALQGEAPFTLEYELIDNGKRKRQKISGIDKSIIVISTEPLNHGGDYALTLASVQDKTGCKIFLDDEMKFFVRQQRPKASFGLLDGKRTTKALEGERIRLPLRLEGVPPWQLSYRKIDDSNGKIINVVKRNTNDILEVDQRGTYELIDVSDAQCPGTVDPSTASLQVEWIPRPEIRLADNAGLEPDGEKFWKREVCEGDVDAVQINLLG
jgi:nucleoporin POM152